MMKAVVCVANIAGRVGKTTTAVHLAAELALRGFATLLIDADPQAEATARLIDPESVARSDVDVLFAPGPRRRSRNGAPSVSFADVLVTTCVPRLSLAPSTIRLAACEGDTPLSFYELNSQLKSLDRPYDFAIIDTPSSLGPITAACVFASTHLLAPVAPRTQAVQGLRCLVEKLGDMPCIHGQVELLGVVCNLFDCRSHSSGEFYEGLRREWGDKVFETKIHRDEMIEGCATRRQPVQTYSPTSIAATLYAGLADEVTLRLGVTASPGVTV